MEWIIVTVIVILAAFIACILWAKQLSKHTFHGTFDNQSAHFDF